MVGMPLLIIMVKYVGFFPNSVHDIVVVIGDKEYQVSSFIDLIPLKNCDNTLVEIMDGIEVQYY